LENLIKLDENTKSDTKLNLNNDSEVDKQINLSEDQLPLKLEKKSEL